MQSRVPGVLIVIVHALATMRGYILTNNQTNNEFEYFGVVEVCEALTSNSSFRHALKIIIFVVNTNILCVFGLILEI
jgi:hypothetical protein